MENLIEVAKATMISLRLGKNLVVPTFVMMHQIPQSSNGRNDAEWHKHTLFFPQEDNRISYKPVNMQPKSVEAVALKTRCTNRSSE